MLENKDMQSESVQTLSCAIVYVDRLVLREDTNDSVEIPLVMSRLFRPTRQLYCHCQWSTMARNSRATQWPRIS